MVVSGLYKKIRSFLVSIQFTFLEYNHIIVDSRLLIKELGFRIKRARKDAGLTQNDIAKQINISRRYIIQIEKGKAKNVSIYIILDYLYACDADIPAFFADLQKAVAKKDYESIISNIDMPKDYRLRKKVLRDTELYYHKIHGQKSKTRPLSLSAQQKALSKFGTYRTTIETLEALAYKILAGKEEARDQLPSPILNPFYRSFVRQIYKTLKQNRLNNRNLDCGFTPIVERWVKKGLREDLLQQIKDAIIKHFEPVKP